MEMAICVSIIYVVRRPEIRYQTETSYLSEYTKPGCQLSI